MKLVELDGRLVRLGDEAEGGGRSILNVERVDQADGVIFLCPGCYRQNGGDVGTHSVLIWIVGRVPAAETPTSRWQASGTSAADLTLSPSVNVLPDRQRREPELGTRRGCPGWHGWIRAGALVDA